MKVKTRQASQCLHKLYINRKCKVGKIGERGLSLRNVSDSDLGIGTSRYKYVLSYNEFTKVRKKRLWRQDPNEKKKQH